MKASEDGYVNSFIVCPSGVFGLGDGPDRKAASFFPFFIYAKRGGVLCWGREQYLWYGMLINLIKSISGYVLNMVDML